MNTGNSVAIVGAGTMGRQIGLHLTAHGVSVNLYDPDEGALTRALNYVDETAPGLVRDRLIPATATFARDRITTGTDLERAVENAWMIIEAVPERMDIKHDLFSRLSALVDNDVILATNSSSFRSGLLVEVTSHPERLMNVHFLNHPWQRPAVELMTSGDTEPALLTKVERFLKGCGLYPVIVRGESTGFLFNRIWRAIKKESLKVVAAGHGDPEDIDRFWCMSTGLKLGPFALMDRVGLDVVLDIERHYASESGDPNDEPPSFLEEMVRERKLGVKSGEGFYTYPDPPFEHPDWPYEK